MTGINYFITTNGDLAPAMARPNAIKRNKVVLHIDEETHEVLYAFAYNAPPLDKYGLERTTKNSPSMEMTHYWTEQQGWREVKNQYSKIR